MTARPLLPAVVFVSLLMPSQALAQTLVEGVLVQDTTWTAQQSPIEVTGDIRIPEGVTLTIEAGTEVRIAARDSANLSVAPFLGPCPNEDVEFIVEGSVDIQGEQGSPVHIHSAVEEPTLSANCQSDDYWYGFTLFAGASFEAEHAHIEDTWSVVQIHQGPSASILISDSTFQNIRTGVFSDPPDPAGRNNEVIIERTRILDFCAGSALRLVGGQAIVEDTIIHNGFRCLNNGRAHALHISDGGQDNSLFSADHLTIENVDIPFNLTKHAQGSTAQFTNSIVSNRAVKTCAADLRFPYERSGNLFHNTNAGGWVFADDALFENPLFFDIEGDDFRITSNSVARRPVFEGGRAIGALDYDGTPTGLLVGHLYEDTTIEAGQSTLLEGDLIVEPGVTLTIEEGALIEAQERDLLSADVFGDDPQRNQAEVIILGALDLQGRAQEKITFESVFDGRPWYGIHVATDAEITFDHTIFRDAAFAIQIHEGAVAQVRDAIFEDCHTRAIVALDGSELHAERAQFGRFRDGALHNGACLVELRDGDHTIRGSTFDRPSGTALLVIFNEDINASALIDHNTVYNPGFIGIQVANTLPASVDIRNNNVVKNNNNQFAIRIDNQPVELRFNNVWNFASNPPIFGPVGLSEGNIAFNPLMNDPESGDFEPTDHSPLIDADENGEDIGAVPHDQAETATRLLGTLHTDLVLTPDDGPIPVLGDVIVPVGRTLTLRPGTELVFATDTDAMRGGVDTARIELIVHGRLIAQGLGDRPVVMRSDALEEDRAPGQWFGVRLLEGSTGHTIQNIRISESINALSADIDESQVISGVESRRCREDHIRLDGRGPFQITGNRLQGGEHGIVLNDRDFDGVGQPIPIVATLERNIISSIVEQPIWVATNHRDSRVVIDHNSIYDSGSHSLLVYQAQVDEGVEITNNILAFSRQFGIFAANANITVPTERFNNIWRHSRGLLNWTAPDPSDIEENPLFVNPDGERDEEAPESFALSPESHSIGADEDGDDQGALPTNGQEPSAGLIGRIPADRTVGPGEVEVLGDIVIPAGVTLTLQPGTELLIHREDEMRSGADINRIEIIVHGNLTALGGGAPVIIRDVASSRARDLWFGIRVQPGGLLPTFSGVEIHNALVGMIIDGLGPYLIEDLSVTESTNGVDIHGLPGLAEVRLLGARMHGLDNGVRVRLGNLPPQEYTDHAMALSVERSLFTAMRLRGLHVAEMKEGDQILVRHNTFHLAGTSPNEASIRFDGNELDARAEVVNNIVSAAPIAVVKVGGFTPEVHHNVLFATRAANFEIDATNINYKPLFVDEDNLDLRITHRSPARNLGEGQTDIGALPFEGDLTVPLAGFLHEDLTLTNDEQWALDGDMIVLPGRSLRLEAGTELFVRPQDALRGGALINRAEIIVQGTFDPQGTRRSPVTIESFLAIEQGASPTRRDWSGITLAPEAPHHTLEHLRLRHMSEGLKVLSSAGADLRSLEIETAERGVDLEASAGPVNLERSLFTGVTLGALRLRNNRARIISNVFHSNRLGNTALSADLEPLGARASVLFINNTLNNNDVAIRAHRLLDGDLALLGNAITNNRTSIQLGAFEVELRGNNAFGNTSAAYPGFQSPDPSNLQVEPGYEDAANGVLRLLEDSLMVDRGVPDALLDTDRDRLGQPRTLPGAENQPALPDIGAFEYNIFGLIALDVDPTEVFQGLAATLTFVGQGFDDATRVILSQGLQADGDPRVLDAETLEQDVTIDLDAALGPRTVGLANDLVESILPDAIRVISSPEISAVEPEQIIQGDARAVRVEGARFSPGAQVFILNPGGVEIDNIAIAPALITFTLSALDAAALGPRSFRVVNPDGGAFTLPDAFEVVPPQPLPIVESVDPQVVAANDQHALTIEGQNFQPGATVRFSGLGITVLTEPQDIFVSDRALSLIIGVARFVELDARDLIITNPDGGVGILPEGLRITDVLRLEAITPERVVVGDGNVLFTIEGEGLQRGMTYRLEGPGDEIIEQEAEPDFVNSRRDRVTFSIGDDAVAGNYDLVVERGDGATDTLEDALRIDPPQPPELTGLVPECLPQGAERAPVFIQGRLFTDVAGVDLGPGVDIIGFDRTSSQSISLLVSVDALAVPGPRDVTVTFENSTETRLGGFCVQSRARVLAIDPTEVPIGATDVEVVVTGENLNGLLTFDFGDLDVEVDSTLDVISDREVVLVINEVRNGAEPGPRDLIVRLGDEEVDRLEEALELIAPVSVDGIVPDNALANTRDLPVTVTGAGFPEDTTFRILGGGVSVADSRRVDENTLTGEVSVSPGAEPGPRVLRAVTPGGFILDVPGAFTVRPEPFVTVIVEPRINAGQSADVTVFGLDLPDDLSFRFSSGVTIEDNPGPQALSTRAYAMRISADTGAPEGPRDLIVTRSDGAESTFPGRLLVINPEDELDFCDLNPTDLLCACPDPQNPRCNPDPCEAPDPPSNCGLDDPCDEDPLGEACLCQQDPEDLDCRCLQDPDLPQCQPEEGLVAAPGNLFFLAEEGGVRPAPQQVQLSSFGPPLDWSATSDQPWLTLSDDTGTTPGAVEVAVNTTGLDADDAPFLGRLTFESGIFVQVVEVTLQLERDIPPEPTLVLLPDIVSAQVAQGDQMAPAVVQVAVTDGGAYTFTVFSDEVDVVPGIDQTPALIELSVDTRGLAARRAPYQFPVSVTAPFLAQTEEVILRVNVFDPGEDAGDLLAAPTTVTLAAEEGATEPVSTTLQVVTRGGIQRAFTIEDLSAPFLSATTRDRRTPGTVVVTLDPTGLLEDDSPLSATLTLRADGDTLEVPISVFIGDLPPVADAGLNATVAPTTYRLDGRASRSPLGRDIAFAWRQLTGPVQVDLLNADTPEPSFRGQIPGEYTFELVARDEQGLEHADIVVITVREVPPTAFAGVDLVYLLETEARIVTLHGERSADGNGDTIQHLWRQIGGPEVQLSDTEAPQPSFEATEAGRYTFELKVIAPNGDEGGDEVSLTLQRPGNTVPTAIAAISDGGRVLVNDSATLDGSASTHGGDGEDLTFLWQQTSGPIGRLSDTESAVATFEAQAPGLVRFSLTVSDGEHTSAPALVHLLVDEINNQVPTAVLGERLIELEVGEHLSLDGSGSFNGEEDPQGLLLGFFFDLEEGTTTELRPLDDAGLWDLSPVLMGSHEVSLQVSDQTSPSAPARAWVVAHSGANRVPLVETSSAESGFVGQGLVLSAEGNEDPDGDPLSYRWIQVGGPLVGLEDPLAEVTRFEPLVAGTYRFELRLDDGQSLGPPEAVEVIEVVDAPNEAPVADAGDDQALDFDSGGVIVQLDGTGSSDPDGDPLSFVWRPTEGPLLVDLDDATSPTPGFTAPFGGEYVFELIVGDGRLVSEPDEVRVIIDAGGIIGDPGDPPKADAGEDQDALVGATVTLDASGSTDPEGADLFFNWRLVEGPEGADIVPMDASEVFATFVPPVQGVYTFEVTVSDGAGSDRDTTVVRAFNGDPSLALPPVADAGEDLTLKQNESFDLDGSGSTDPNDDPITFLWVQRVGPVVLDFEPNARTQPLTPTVAGDYVFELVVNDGIFDSEPDRVEIVVEPATIGVGPPGSPDGGCDCNVLSSHPTTPPWWPILALALILWLRARPPKSSV